MSNIDTLYSICGSLCVLKRNSGHNIEYPEYGNSQKLIEFFKNFNFDFLTQEFIDSDNSIVLKKNKEKELKELYKNLDDKIIELISEIELNKIEVDDNYRQGDEEDFISEIINNKDGYIVVFDDSDGERIWYECADGKAIVEHLYKTRHRKSIGMGCNQYIHMVIQNGKVIDFKKD